MHLYIVLRVQCCPSSSALADMQVRIDAVTHDICLKPGLGGEVAVCLLESAYPGQPQSHVITYK